jgi:hypothetical protein
MRYRMLIYSQETSESLPPEEATNLMQAHSAVIRESARKGVLRGVERLEARCLGPYDAVAIAMSAGWQKRFRYVRSRAHPSQNRTPQGCVADSDFPQNEYLSPHVLLGTSNAMH